MSDSIPRHRLINNEILSRGHNRKVKRVIQKHTPQEEQDGLTIDFYCECSDLSCKTRVSMTIEEYEELHSNEAQFIIAKGHETPMLEKVIRTKLTKKNAEVVEKYAL